MKPMTLHYTEPVPGVLSYPHRIDAEGNVGAQEFWRGRPSRLLGFVTNRHDFDIQLVVEDPTGLYPVFVAHGEFYTWDAPVSRWSSRTIEGSET